MNTDLPDSMLFQWHLTERCNASCAHCYQDGGDRPESSYSELQETLTQIRRFVKSHSEAIGKKSKALITLTGGEPFVHPDFMKLLDDIREPQEEEPLPVGILTNGLCSDRNTAMTLKRLGVRFVQVSIEGTRETHEKIRGTGTYDKAIEGLQNLITEQITTYISFTAHKQNYREFGDVADLGARIGVNRVWSDRLIPMGHAESMRDLLLSPQETQELVELMHETRTRLKHSKTEVALHRALQFAADGSQPYFCRAGWSLLTLLPGGELVPCRRMPLAAGNFLEKGLWELYIGSVELQNLRDPGHIPTACGSCFYSDLCRGGLRCLAYAVTGDPWAGDPGCWLMQRKIDNNNGGEGYGCL